MKKKYIGRIITILLVAGLLYMITPGKTREAKHSPTESQQTSKSSQSDTTECVEIHTNYPDNKNDANGTENQKITIQHNSTRAITKKDDFMAPKFSPDGLDILCTKGKYNGLYLVSRDGSTVTKISGLPGIGYNAQWSADGNYIIAQQGEQTLVFDRNGQEVPEDSVANQLTTTIYAKDGVLYHKDGEKTSETDEKVTTHSEEDDQYFSPVTSPDQSKLAYIGLSSGIHIKDLESGEEIKVGTGTNINWTPDSSGIIYCFTQDDGEKIIAGDIYFAYADGSRVINLTNTPNIIEVKPHLSHDGSQLTYEVDGQIYTVDIHINGVN